MSTNPTSAQPSSPERSPPRTIALAAGALVAATLVAYHGSFAGPFLFDDQASIVSNLSIRQLWPPWSALLPPHAAGETVGGRPVLNLSFALNHAVSGDSVWSFHTLNLLIHVAAGLLLFGLLRRTLLRTRVGAAALPLAFVVAALWLLHPLQTEAVTYLSQRGESLAAFFLLLTVYAFVRGADSPAPCRWFALSAGACLLGMGTKETTVVAPLLVLLYDRTFLTGSFRTAWKQRRPVHLTLAATWLLLAALLLGTGGSRGGTAGFASMISPWTYALTQCRAIVHYVRLALWPGPLVFDYGTGVAPNLGAVWPQGIAVLLLLGGTVIALGRRPALGFLGAWFLVVLAPSSSFIPIASQPIAEHRMYLPLAAVLLSLVLAAHAWLPRRWGLAWFAVAAVLGGLTAQRNQTYRSELALWSDTTAHAPGNARAHSNLGNAFLAAGRTADAIASYETALQLQPDYADAHHNLGRAFVQSGRLAEAIPHYKAALLAKPDSVRVLTSCASALAQAGDPRQARPYFERALQIDPRAADTHYNFANALLRLGDLPSARSHYEVALRLQPSHVSARVNLAAALLRLGRADEAIPHYEKVLHLAPDDVGAFIDLANILVQQGRFAEAAAHYEHALRLRPDLTVVKEQLDRLRAAAAATRP